jgi:hypothetical protein
MTEQQKLTRPPESGPGSDRASWVAFATQELDMPESDFADKTEWTRDKIIALLDSDPKAYSEKDDEGNPTGVRVVPEADATRLRKAPEGVSVVESAKDVRDALDRRTWAVPVEGGYAAENEIAETEK